MKENNQSGLDALAEFILKIIKLRFTICYYLMLFILSFLLGMFISYKMGW